MPPGVVGGAEPQVDAGAAAPQLARPIAGAIQRLLGHLQQQTLLGIHAFGFAGGDAKKGWIKLIYLPQKSSKAAAHAVGSSRAGVVVVLPGPAIPRHLPHGTAARQQVAPQRLRAREVCAIAPCRIATAQADYGNRFRSQQTPLILGLLGQQGELQGVQRLCHGP